MGTAEQIHGVLTGTALAASAFGYAESQLRFHEGDALTALDGPRRQGVITGRGRALLCALTPAQRSSRAARELRATLDDTTGHKEIPA